MFYEVFVNPSCNFAENFMQKFNEKFPDNWMDTHDFSWTVKFVDKVMIVLIVSEEFLSGKRVEEIYDFFNELGFEPMVDM